jgi:hypothetical protein
MASPFLIWKNLEGGWSGAEGLAHHRKAWMVYDQAGPSLDRYRLVGLLIERAQLTSTGRFVAESSTALPFTLLGRASLAIWAIDF